MNQPREGGACQQFWCNLCKVACASAVNLQTHFLGSKHMLLEKALKTHGIGKSDSPEPAGPGNVMDEAAQVPDSAQMVSLGEHLERSRSTEPAIGLEYIFEYRTLGNHLWYECQLCDCENGLATMFMHVVGARHRQAYLKKHYPEMADVGNRCPDASKRLRELAGEVEARDGRKKIQVVTDAQQLKRKYESEEDKPGPNKNKKTDYTSDEGFINPPPSPSRQTQSDPPQSLPSSPTFQELKKAHAEAARREGLDKSVDGFGTKKDLLDFLSEFEILCEDDAAFILKVTQNFTQSLVNYREKVKENAVAAAAAPEVTYPPQQQVNAPQATGQNIYTEYPPKATPGQQVNAPRHTGENIYTEYPPKNTPGQQTPPLGQNMYTEYPPKNLPGQQAPVAGPPSSAFHAGTPSFAATSNPVVPPPANLKGLPSGLGPLQETNKATIEFFTSIKNMDAKEVSATLNRIAATNPAFKGIDIPNVIKILQESGSLKPKKGNS